MTYCEIANLYIEDVLDGTIPSCKWAKLACKRQKENLKNGVDGFHFDNKKAERVCNFIYNVPHVKGKVKGKKVPISPWWVFIYTTFMGWTNDSGFRRFRMLYVSVAKKNNKSTGIAPLLLYLAFADGEGGAEVYTAATTKEQAGIVYRTARNMVKQCLPLAKKLGLKVAGGNIEKSAAGSIYQESTSSFIQALSKDNKGSLDGLDIHCASLDELHAHPTRDVWDILEGGTVSRDQPVIMAITTAGYNLAGICYEQESYVKKVLEGTNQDETYFGIVYTLDDEDLENKERLFTDEELWKKANPNYGLSVNPEDLKRKAVKAMQVSSAQGMFLTKHLNIWSNADSAWMDMIAWQKAEGTFTPQDCIDWDLYAACDLASKNDIACIAQLFEKEGKYRLIVTSFINEEAVENDVNSQYRGWVEEGHLIQTDGNVTDYEAMEEHITDLADNYNLKESIFDPWQSSYISQRLVKQGMEVVDYRQTVQNMSEPMKEFLALVRSGKLEHDGNPCTTWQFSNVVSHVDAKDNEYPRKEQPQNKIDAPVASIMALGRATAGDDGQGDFNDFIKDPII